MSGEAESQNMEDDRENHTENLQQCAICQDSITLENASFVDLCLHQYCFPCLKQWCEVKAECPLCKQKIEKIIYGVKSPQTYKEFFPRPQTPTVLQGLGISSQSHRALFAFLETFNDTSDEPNYPSNISDHTNEPDETDTSDDELDTLQINVTAPERESPTAAEYVNGTIISISSDEESIISISMIDIASEPESEDDYSIFDVDPSFN